MEEYTEQQAEMSEATPPPCNTGALDTQSVEVLIDAICFTLHGKDALEDSDSLLGYENEWESLGYGRHFYPVGERRGHLFRYSGGKPEMGVHIEGMGKACRELEERGVVKDWPAFFLDINCACGKVTRVDIAIDDYVGFLDIKHIREQMESGNFTSVFTDFQVQMSWKSPDFDRKGITCYFGSRKSESLIRIYDKAQEQGVDRHWIRVEMEFKGDLANRVAEFIAVNEDLLYLKGLLYQLLDFKDPSSDSNKSRWPTAKWWSDFLDEIRKIKLPKERVRKRYEDSLAWVEKQVAPTLAMLALANGGDMGPIDKLIRKGQARIRPKHISIINETLERIKDEGPDFGLSVIEKKENEIYGRES